MKRKTKVEKYGAFWCVFVVIAGQWMRMHDLYLTKQAAIKGRAYWANY